MSQGVTMVLRCPKQIRVFNYYVLCRCCHLTASGPPKALIDNEITWGLIQNMRPSVVSLLLYRKLTWMPYSASCYTDFYPSSICILDLASFILWQELLCLKQLSLPAVVLTQTGWITRNWGIVSYYLNQFTKFIWSEVESYSHGIILVGILRVQDHRVQP